MKLAEKSIERFLKELGFESPSPGGGSAAALTGAMGASLAEMVARINRARFKKKRSSRGAAETAANSRIHALAQARRAFCSQAEQDVKAFGVLLRFSKEKRHSRLYQQALKKAAQIPLGICESAVQVLRMGEPEVKRTSRWLASDLAEAAILLEAAFYSARLNVEVNLEGISDRKFTAYCRRRLETWQSRGARSRKKICKAAAR